ncbi:unnamed protein product (mitochondrion) [Plasmodiophora brassicae]|uniref:Uncharacterized protein n=2 Tax=Plasmodiophora brassicae TaxID=37360 RepID=A0A3P3YC37_PLABS|nr:unnamed protein product [Plasmodiophora brassicae]
MGFASRCHVVTGDAALQFGRAGRVSLHPARDRRPRPTRLPMIDDEDDRAWSPILLQRSRRRGAYWNDAARRRHVVAILAGVTLVTLLLLVRPTRVGSPGGDDEAEMADQRPPRFVTLPELKSLPYCGLDPLNEATLPKIPAPNRPDLEIVQVQAFIRHGARFFNQRTQCWPGQDTISYRCELTHMSIPGTNMTDASIPPPNRIFRKRFMKNRNDYKGNCRIGQLTVHGYHQEEVLGGLFRERYVGTLISPVLNNSEVHFRSDDVPRTVLSAESFFTGLFPPEGPDSPPPTQIVNLWTMDVDRETEVVNAHECPGVAKQYKKAQHTTTFVEHEKTFTAPLRRRLSEIMRIPTNELDGKNKFDCLFISLCRGDPVPEGVDRDLVADVEFDNRFRVYSMIQYPDRVSGSRLVIGPLLREIHGHLQQAVLGRSVPKFSLYSGHDTGPIMLLLSAFGVDDQFPWAPFASYISLELYRRVDSVGRPPEAHFIRIIHNGHVLRLPMADANEFIPFPQFMAFLATMIPSPEECPDIYQ